MAKQVFLLVLGLMLVITPTARAGEYAVLSTGFRLHIDRHETSGATIRLYVNEGITEIPIESITRFEPDETQPPLGEKTSAPSRSDFSVPQATGARTQDARTQNELPDPSSLIANAAKRSGLPPAFLESIAIVESNLRQDAISPRGAIGVMQLMPATAQALAANPKNLAENIEAGARLLRDLLIRYNGDVVKALSAYNAGAAAVDRYRGMPPYSETQNYVDRVIRTYIKHGGR